ncbi:hypothetical protein [Microbacterium sp. CPCC 204701]|uniref:hypothetical protein n=1 Tax=Microbacterium sp. CPCC 204701 TaxID=2493084 RepID=UPI000FDA0CA8|nr:hypothetical protein [Microbacterium sp. CPCC 204701]
MERADLHTARFDVVSEGGRSRFTVGEEQRGRESDGSIPTEAWFHGEEYRLDVEDDDGVTVYVRRL